MTAAMNAPAVGRRWFLDSRRGLLGWSAGLLGVVLLYLPLYASMRETDLLSAKLEALPSEMLEGLGMSVATMATPWGYTQQTVFGMLGMLLLLCAAIGQGTRALAGDEESGGLELVVAHATTRTGVLLARAAAVHLIVLVLAAVLGLGTLAINGSSGLHLSPVNIAAVTVALGLLCTLHATVALTAGAITGRRGSALAVTSTVGVLGYFAHTMGAKVADWVPSLSPFHWAFAAEPLHNGFDGRGLGLLAGASVVLLTVAVIALNRRDLHA